MKWSAGSLWGNSSFPDSTATWCVNVASRIGAAAVASLSHWPGSASNGATTSWAQADSIARCVCPGVTSLPENVPILLVDGGGNDVACGSTGDGHFANPAFWRWGGPVRDDLRH